MQYNTLYYGQKLRFLSYFCVARQFIYLYDCIFTKLIFNELLLIIIGSVNYCLSKY